MSYVFTRLLCLTLAVSAAVAVGGCRRLEIARERIASLFGWSMAAKEKPASSNGNDDAKTSIEGRELAWFAAKRGDIALRKTARGQLRSAERIEIRADRRVRVSPARVKAFSAVKRGQVLFEVDTTELEQRKIELAEREKQTEIDIKAAIAQADLARKQLTRKKALAEKGITPQKEVDEAVKAVRMAESAEETKKLELQRARREAADASQQVQTANFVSPIDGLVSQIVRGGDEVNQGQVVAVIGAQGKLALYVPADEVMLAAVRKGTAVDVKLDAAPARLLAGTVAEIIAGSGGGMGQGSGGQLRIDLRVEDVTASGAREGFEAEMSVTLASSANAITVPLAALQTNAGKFFVLVSPSDGSSPSPRAVEIGVRNDLEVEITAGLRDGDFAVVAGGSTAR